MARPTKSAKVLTECSQTKEEIQTRIENEEKLRGSDDKVVPPTYLNARQKRIFNYIVQELEASKILGNLDVYILATAAISIDRLQEIEKSINKDPARMFDRNVLGAKDKYTKDWFRACNELSLSPASRAKIGNINTTNNKNEDDPLLKVLKSKGDGNK